MLSLFINIYCNKLIEAKTEATLLDSFRLIGSYFPYVGIIQIRLSVEGHTFLSACHTSSRLYSIVTVSIIDGLHGKRKMRAEKLRTIKILSLMAELCFLCAY